jgi:tRNA A-37 threonylcarbamoyl transferase component Bud32
MNWRMMGLEGVPLRRGGWIFFLLDYDARFSEELRETLIDSAFGAIDGTLKKRVRRSRHAETWAQHLGSGGGPDVYFKVIDAAHGAHAIKLLFKGSRAAHVARISERLRADGIGVPEILLLGAEQRGGREIVVTVRVEGRNVPRHFRSQREPLTAKRAILRALGAEVARLHRAGYLHGDLTPYNIFVTGVDPPQFVFIDHDRTRRTILSRFERPRMRNLVQLGHLDLNTITNTDRMRVWCGYSATMPTRRRRVARRRVVQMLRTRIARDRDNHLTQSAHAVVPGRTEVREG